MGFEPSHMLDERMVRVWRIQEAIGLAASAAVAASVAVPVTLNLGVIPWVYALCGAVVAVQLVCLLVLPQIRYRRWRYEVTTTDVLIRSGLIVVSTSVIPMVRVQHVETKQGPVLKANGLASITVTTAGSSFEIPGLAADEAERLRDQVAVLARIAQEDV